MKSYAFALPFLILLCIALYPELRSVEEVKSDEEIGNDLELKCVEVLNNEFGLDLRIADIEEYKTTKR